MEKIFMILVLCVVVKAVPQDDDVPILTKVPCAADQYSERSALIEKARCGAPKEVFVVLRSRAAYEEIYPGAVWVRRCFGLCDHEGPDSKCVARETVVRHIPIKIYNVKTNKEACSSYPVEEHASCGCSADAPGDRSWIWCGVRCLDGHGDCAVPRVFNPRKCSCQCPNVAERRACLSQVCR